jgi:hypothetical protein
MEKQRENSRWADYALTTRWGSGEKLIVGLAPNQSVPMSGLHAIIPTGTTAAYTVGLFNSTVVQEMAESLPPGEIRQSDLLDLGLPLVEEAQDEIGSVAVELAELVGDFISEAGDRWPGLEEALREDIALGSTPEDSWLPRLGPEARWGQLQNLQWVTDVESGGTMSSRIRTVDVSWDLFGPAVIVQGGTSGRLRIRIGEDDDKVLEALVAYLKGLQIAGRTLRDVPESRAPIDHRILVQMRQDDLVRLHEFRDTYQTLRASIDSSVDELL